MRNVFLILAAMFMVSCVQDNIENVAVEGDLVETKLIFSEENIIEGEMLVCFTEEAVLKVEAGVSRSAGTRSGINEFDAVLQDAGVTSFERLFPINERYEERARECGLHLWYHIKFDSQVKMSEIARAFAKVGEVKVVESVNRIQSLAMPETVSECETSAVEPMAADTKGAIFNDPDLSKQWHYINDGSKSYYSGAKAGADVNLDEAWPITAGDSRIIVAIVDDAVKYDHPDLAANMWVNTAELNGKAGADDDRNGYVDDVYGYNFCKMSPTLDLTGSDHGTHVAGTVAAVNNNRIGGCGVAGGTGKGDGVRLMSCQIFVGNSTTSDANMAKAYQYMADQGVAISQNSWGFSTKMTSDRAYAQTSSAELSALKYFIMNGGAQSGGCAALKGGLVVFAAGNDSWNYSTYPGAYRDFISVTAISCDYTPAYYTNHGRGCNIAAPGGDYLQSYSDTGWTKITETSSIYSTTFTNGMYGYKQGTSMACPHVSGVSALGLAHALKLGKSYTVDEYKSLLLTSVNDINRYCTGKKNSIGSTGSLTQLNLSDYEGNMGVGYIDAFRVLMNVEGTPCVPVRVGVRQTVDVSQILGGGVASLKILEVSMSESDKTKLGVEGTIAISQTGGLQIKCNKQGSAIVTVKFVAGGQEVGVDTQTGGMEVTKKFAVLARGFATNGGWL